MQYSDRLQLCSILYPFLRIRFWNLHSFHPSQPLNELEVLFLNEMLYLAINFSVYLLKLEHHQSQLQMILYCFFPRYWNHVEFQNEHERNVLVACIVNLTILVIETAINQQLNYINLHNSYFHSFYFVHTFLSSKE
jgi:hypothetical protein